MELRVKLETAIGWRRRPAHEFFLKVLCTMQEFCGALEHAADEGDDVETRQGLGVALVVFHPFSASRHPGE
jgi:hypothetical protein